mgnify:CR=1 FL=1
MAKASQVVLLENEFYLIKAPNGKVLEIKNLSLIHISEPTRH